MSDGEASKLSRHLALLKDEYRKLQIAFGELERQHSLCATGERSDNGFVSRLVQFVASLYNQSIYSDITIKLTDRTIKSHKFVLSARGDKWSTESLENVSQLDWTILESDVGEALAQWLYTENLSPGTDDQQVFLLKLMKAAHKFALTSLINKCVGILIPALSVRNCVRFYEAAEEIKANTLREHCLSLINAHWNDLGAPDFEPLSAPMLYKLLEQQTTHSLHAAIRLGREDVVFLDLVKYASQIPGRLDSVDVIGDVPLDLALRLKHEGIAKALVQQRASLNTVDSQGFRLLHRAILRRDEFSCQFLIEHGASVSPSVPDTLETALHLLAQSESQKEEDWEPGEPDSENQKWTAQNVAELTQLLLDKGADPNAAARDGRGPLHYAVQYNNQPVLQVLLKNKRLDLEKKDQEGLVPLWYALQDVTDADEKCSAAQLVAKGASCNAVVPGTGESLLHLAACKGLETAALFLVEHGALTNSINLRGETPLHVSCAVGLADLTRVLLRKGANCNLQTTAPPIHDYLASFQPENPFGADAEGGEAEKVTVWKQTPLHLAIAGFHAPTVQVLLDFKAESDTTKHIVPNVNLKNSADEAPLGLALRQGMYNTAHQLIASGADVDVTNNAGLTLLHQSLLQNDEKSGLFLLDNGADVHARTNEGLTCVMLCIRQGLGGPLLEGLCRRGSNMEDGEDNGGDPPLWVALSSGLEDLASILVRHGVDTDHWGPGPDGCQQTLLHRAIDENNEKLACFLIRSGCDLNSPRRPGVNGKGGDESRDLATPLHLCCQWGLEETVMTLLEHGAQINAKDAEGKTPLQVAIENQHAALIQLFLNQRDVDITSRDSTGKSAFATALTVKNNKAAAAILRKDPSAAEQYDSKGKTFLHNVVIKGDLESLLFLLSVHVDVKCRTQDAARLTSLHLAVQTGKDEMILRNLILADSELEATGPRHQTALHMTAEKEDGAAFMSILLGAKADPNAVDDGGNTPLHIAARYGHVNVARVLLTESNVDAESRNLRGQNPLHVAALSGREAGAALLRLFLECMPSYPINAPDVEGNTPLLLAYTKGNVGLCLALVRAGACLGATNKQGVSIFNYQVPTKQLLCRLLDHLTEEPPWAEYDYCMECGGKFGITTRKHHCRHCGRVLCSKCSDQVVPVLKFNLAKPVRVCQLCFEVLGMVATSP